MDKVLGIVVLDTSPLDVITNLGHLLINTINSGAGTQLKFKHLSTAISNQD